MSLMTYIREEREITTALVRFIDLGDEILPESVLKSVKSLDLLIQEVDQYVDTEDTIRFLKEAKRYLKTKLKGQAVEMSCLFSETDAPFYIKEYTGTYKEVEAILPPKPVETHTYFPIGRGHGTYIPDKFYISKFVTFSGTSGTTYRALTTYKPVDHSVADDLEISEYGYTSFFPEDLIPLDPETKEPPGYIMFPVTQGDKSKWKGKTEQYDGLTMACATWYNNSKQLNSLRQKAKAYRMLKEQGTVV